MDCDEAYLRLRVGNARFVAGESLHPHEERDWRKRLKLAQRPIATVLACSDSQAPPELVFDQGLGDLFVIRVAGNVISPDTLGSIQYAGTYLGTLLFVVLGHDECGPVRAALLGRARHAPQPMQIEALVRLMQPALKEVDAEADFATQMIAAIEANVRWSVAQIRQMPLARGPVEAKRVKIVGAIYELETGTVRFLE
jgi:carbonic anhydrase